VRETQEEVGITPHAVQPRGELHFQFVDGYSLHCTVFTAESFSGTLIETDEALPIWTPIDSIPYHEMWADDIHWLPGVIEGGSFRAYFHFDGDSMLSKHVDWHSSTPNLAACEI
jgi:8-oxo-dGTP diphosphatase